MAQQDDSNKCVITSLF